MDRNEILQKVAVIFRGFFDNETLPITLQTCNEDIEDWDSVAHIQLIFEVESEFGIQFEAEKIAEMTSIEKIVENIQENI
ncbi:acyl carrier protein [Aminipila terrae]|uniref:Acyl carrier protein n=1 Tax=Aminipila terrae TaxID=2697030 RepID=A0A6P1MM52_9FIRM|nr:acyl carrier protein [Aminipila terrae]QHI72075.1 acyl carrier protein [Aminipila terrae]